VEPLAARAVDSSRDARMRRRGRSSGPGWISRGR
jgi:hypothetical protein